MKTVQDREMIWLKYSRHMEKSGDLLVMEFHDFMSAIYELTNDTTTEPPPTSNKCQCEEEHGWTTVMACNKCGFICDPAWQEKKR